MSRVRSRRAFWDPPQATDVAGYHFYIGPADQSDFLAQVDAGNVQPIAQIGDPATTEFIIDESLALEEGTYQFAVVAVDDAGNFSDPYQHEAWSSVPLDVTAPDAPSGGGLEVI